MGTAPTTPSSSAEHVSWRQKLPMLRLSSFCAEDSVDKVEIPLVTSSTLTRGSCAFGSEIFSSIMDNLVRNPNITSSHLFRADVFYDSDKDASFESLNDAEKYPTEYPSASTEYKSSFVKHMKRQLRPNQVHVDGFELTRVVVRQLVPRNPSLDRELVQSCYFLKAQGASRLDGHVQLGCEGDQSLSPEPWERTLVIYVPHVESEEQIPWYHPNVRILAFLHDWKPEPDLRVSNGGNRDHAASHANGVVERQRQNSATSATGEISIHFAPFAMADITDSTIESTFNDRLNRTFQNLLRTIARHGDGQLAGYKKRVHHDILIPQKRLQNRYTLLKQKHAKAILNEYWSETTDSTKGVFEDLGIAAFLIELWSDMYGKPLASEDDNDDRQPFPGFVDIGCGNGVLVYILLSEGYPGYGFDARRRKTWSAFPQFVQDNLNVQIIVPDILSLGRDDLSSTDLNSLASTASKSTPPNATDQPQTQTSVHDGRFPPGTFIVSNHADELSPWTPLLALRSACSFICIPCCSHDLTGARHRFAPSFVKHDLEVQRTEGGNIGAAGEQQKTQQQPSAYATLTAYIAHLARTAGYQVEREALRIPSTRNVCLVGRRRSEGFEQDEEAAVRMVQDIAQSETALSLAEIRERWCARASKIAGPAGTATIASSSKH